MQNAKWSEMQIWQRIVGSEWQKTGGLYNPAMATSVKLRTAVPSVAEFGKSLGISEKRQKSLISLVKRNSPAGRFVGTQKSDSRAVETVRSEKVSRGKR